MSFVLPTLLEFLNTEDDVINVMATPPTTVGASSLPDMKGAIRKIKNAHLVHKKIEPDGTYTELWIYNTGKALFRDELQVKKDILAATDIPLGNSQSLDGNQKFTMWSVGNVQMIKVEGLPQ